MLDHSTCESEQFFSECVARDNVACKLSVFHIIAEPAAIWAGVAVIIIANAAAPSLTLSIRLFACVCVFG